MKRQIIEIDEDLCTGCGNCVPNCPEGAIQVIDGKARVISDAFCDGLGACIGHCPEGAIDVTEREAEPYDEALVMREKIIPKGANTIRAHLEHLLDHGQQEFYDQAVQVLEEQGVPNPLEGAVTALAGAQGDSHAHAHSHASDHGSHFAGCPGAATLDLRGETAPKESTGAAGSAPTPSELRTWPIQLRLLNPMAPYLQRSHLVVAADCVGFAYPDFHRDFLAGKVLTIFCPKLDPGQDEYVEKLAEIFRTQEISRVTVAHMEVPCCWGVTQIVKEALRRAGKNVPLTEHTIAIKGTKL